jgi:DNA-binding IclR family transcriptional regulator
MDKAAPRSAAAAGTQSIERAMEVLRFVASAHHRGARLTDVVDALKLSKSTARRLLGALARSGMVEQNPDNKHYVLGEEAWVLGTLANGRQRLLDAATDSVTRLAKLTGDTAFLVIPRGSYSVCVLREEGAYPIRTHLLQPGGRHPLGISAAGLAILAALPDAEMDAALQANAAVIAEHYPRVQLARVREMAAHTRRERVALNPGMILEGSWALGVAITDKQGRPIGALSIAAIESRIVGSRQESLSALLRTEADTVMQRINTL